MVGTCDALKHLRKFISNAESSLRSQVTSCKICGERSVTGTGFTASTSVLCCQYHSTVDPHLSSPTRYSHQKDKRTQPGNHPKSNFPSGIGEHWIEKCFPPAPAFSFQMVNVVSASISS